LAYVESLEGWKDPAVIAVIHLWEEIKLWG